MHEELIFKVFLYNESVKKFVWWHKVMNGYLIASVKYLWIEIPDEVKTHKLSQELGNIIKWFILKSSRMGA